MEEVSLSVPMCTMEIVNEEAEPEEEILEEEIDNNIFEYMEPQEDEELQVTESEIMASDEMTSGDFTYQVYGNNATITEYVGAGGSVVIPETIDGYTVTVIGSNAFENNTTVTGVNIPKTITDIYSGAFENCIALETVVMNHNNTAEHIVSIGYGVFSGCTSLINVQLSENVTELGSYVFSGCSALTNLTLPESLTSMGYCMIQGTAISSIIIPKNVTSCRTEASDECNGPLADCKTLTEVVFEEGMEKIPACIIASEDYTSYVSRVVIPESVTEIGDYAFSGCSALSSLALPESLTSMGYYMIQGTAISSITIPKNVTSCRAERWGKYNGPLADCETLTEVVFEEGMEKIPSCIMSSEEHTSYVTKVVIPESVTEIGSRAFYSSENLVISSLPEKVKIIGNGAFYQCEKITSMEMSKAITSIGNIAFSNCTALETVVMNYNNTVEYTASIGDYAFSGCTSLTNVQLPENVTSIGDKAFSGCSALRNLKLPENLTSMGCCIIEGTAISSIIIPKKVTSDDSDYIYNGPLAGCDTLTEVVFEDGIEKIPSFIMSSRDSINYVTKVIIPESVTEIGSRAFYSSENLVISSLPENVKIIGSSAFYQCEKIKSMELPKIITSIGGGAFWECTALETIVMNYNDEEEYTASIGGQAFYGCTSLRDVQLSENVTSIGSGAFSGCSALSSLTLPKSLTSMGCCVIKETAITSITIPKNVISCDFCFDGGSLSNCKTLVEVIFEDGMKKIPSYVMEADGYTTSNVSKVVIPESVTEIGEKAFAYNGNLVMSNLPENVKIIGEMAFYQCEKITSMELPKTITSIGEEAFKKCTALETIVMNYNDETEYTASIGESAFEGCTSLKDVQLSENVVKIDRRAFSGCSALSNLILPKSLTSMGSHMIEETAIASITIPKNLISCDYYDNGPLANCKTLTEVIFEDGMEKIPSHVIASKSYTSYVSKVVIPESVTEIGESAFYGSNNWVVSSLPENVKIIGTCAFYQCEKITSMEFPESITDIGYLAFGECTALETIVMNYNSTEEYTVSIEGKAFNGCTNLNDVQLSENVTHIGDNVFSGCSVLSSLTLPQSLELMGECIIEETSISSITIPKNVRSGWYPTNLNHNGPLANCKTLTEVIFEEGIELIPAYIMASYDYNSYVTKVIIPESVTAIGKHAFYKCENMTIYGYINSYAQTYAETNAIPFISVTLSKYASADEVLSKLNLSQLLANVSVPSATINGPSVTIDGKTSSLFTFNASGKITLGDKVQAKVDEKKKKIQVLVGFKDFSGSATLDSASNSNAYWSESYQQVKSLYKGVTGRSVDTTSLWNNFSKVRGKLKSTDCTLGLKSSASVAGYIEFSYASGEIVYSEGGIIMEASMKTELEHKLAFCPAVYVSFGLSADFKGSLKLVKKGEHKYIPNVNANIDLAATLAAGVGAKQAKTYAEFGLKGKISLGMAFPADTPEEAFTASLSASVFFDSKVFGFNGPSYSETFASCPIYPQYISSEPMFSGADIATIDTETVELEEREYSCETEQINGLEAENSEIISANIYPYNEAQLAILNDGTKMLVWIGDDGSKSDINKTSLMYSIYGDNGWSEAEAIAKAEGPDGYPYMYSDGEKILIIWQRVPKLSDSATLTDLLEKADIYYTVYENGEFTKAENINSTDNSIYEMMQTTAFDSENMAVAWVENTENNPFQSEGNSCIKLKERKNGIWSESAIASDLEAVTNISLDYIDGTLAVVYEATKGEKEQIYYSYGEISKVFEGQNAQIYEGVVYYSTEDGMKSYDISNAYSEELAIPALSDYTVVNENSEMMIFTTTNDGFASELAVYTYHVDTGNWSGPVSVTDYDRYIRDYSVASDGKGNVFTALNLVQIQEEEESVYGNASLAVVNLKEKTNLSIGEFVSYEESMVVSGGKLPLKFTVTNSGIQDIDGFDTIILDENGNEIQKEYVECEISSGETVEAQIQYELPTELSKHTITLQIKGESEENVADNSVKVEIGHADIAIENLWLSGNYTEPVLKGNIENIGYANAENVVVTIYASNEEREVIGTKTFENISQGSSAEFEVAIPSTYMEVNPLASGNNLYVTISTDTKEIRLDNNYDSYLIQSKTDAPIVLNRTAITLEQESTSVLNVSYDADGVSDSTEYVWSSSDETVVKVENGMLTAVKEGTATITVSKGEKKAECIVTVLQENPVTGIYLDTTSCEVLIKESKQLSATILPENASNKKVTWSSENPEIASVDSNGLVSGNTIGKTIITATTADGFKYATCTVIVKQDESQVYSASFTGGDGVRGTKPKTITVSTGTIFKLPENTFTKENNKFVGWSDGNSTFVAGSSYKMPYYNVTFTAVWELSVESSATPTISKTLTPTEEPTLTPTEEPTLTPTEEPTLTPTEEPTLTPTEEPTLTPTEEPTLAPTEEPTVTPTEKPTAIPTEELTVTPTEELTVTPTEKPIATPILTEEPTTTPTEKPIDIPLPKVGSKVEDTSLNGKYKVTANKTVEYVQPLEKTKTVKIPATITIGNTVYKVTSISKNAFKNNKELTKVIIGSNITTIGANAFSGCSKLKTVTIGKNVTTIGDKAFYKCTALSKVTIPSKVKKIGKQAFYGCKKLKSITIKTTKLTSKNVGSKAFKGIYSKAKIKVPKSKVKAYKKLLKSKGVGSKAVIKK